MCRRTLLIALLEAAALPLGLGACRQDMHDQPRYKPLAQSPFWPNGTSARELVAGTIERGHTAHEPVFYTGRRRATAPRPPIVPIVVDQSAPPSGAPDKEQLAAWRAITAAEAAGGRAPRLDSEFTDSLPAALLPLTEATLRRGQARFDIYCAVCHDRTGSGTGMIVRRGFTRPPSLHSERLRAVRLGHFFDVMTDGFGAMPSYASQINPADRWAIVAYIRALQLSQYARAQDLK
jgi:mono/diheme cytochrome c family protein